MPRGRSLVPPDPHGVSTPSGYPRHRASRGSSDSRGPSMRSIASSEVHRNTTAPSRWHCSPPSDDASFPGLLCLTTRAGMADPLPARPPGHAACHVRGLGTSLAASTTIPAGASRRRSVLRLHPSRRSPRTDGYPSRDPCPRALGLGVSPRAVVHGRALVMGFRASFPVRARSAAVSGGRRADAFLGFPPPERSLPRVPAPRGCAELPLLRFSGRALRPACVPGSSVTGGSVGPSRDYLLSWGLSPCDRRDATRTETESGRMDSPHGSNALHAARADPSSLVATRPGLASRPGAAVHR